MLDKVDEKSGARPRGTDAARVIQVIETEALEGYGTPDDPIIVKKQYWNFDGELLAVGVRKI